MAVLIDPPRWPAHGRVWSHLTSDASLDELHAFAGAAGIPRRAFEGDHYDVPAEMYRQAVAAGAEEVEGRELLRRLVGAGLRVPKRRGERVLASDRLEGGELPGPYAVDLVASVLDVPGTGSVAAWALVADEDGKVLLAAAGAGRWALPGGPLVVGETVDESLRRALEPTGVRPTGPARPLGYRRLRPLGPPGPTTGSGTGSEWSYQVLLALTGAGASTRGSTWHAPADAVRVLGAAPLGPLLAHAVGVTWSGGGAPR